MLQNAHNITSLSLSEKLQVRLCLASLHQTTGSSNLLCSLLCFNSCHLKDLSLTHCAAELLNFCHKNKRWVWYLTCNKSVNNKSDLFRSNMLLACSLRARLVSGIQSVPVVAIYASACLLRKPRSTQGALRCD